MAALLKITADLLVIVVSSPLKAITVSPSSVGHGLIAGIQADDLEACRAERDRVRLEDALLVGPAMNQGIDSAADSAGIRIDPCVREPGDAAQFSDLPAPAKLSLARRRPDCVAGCAIFATLFADGRATHLPGPDTSSRCS